MKYISAGLLKKILINENSIELSINYNNDKFNDFICFSVSHFNHWLTEEEYIDAPLICYADVRSNPDLLNSFNIINRNFITFYKKLFKLNNGLVLAQGGYNPFESIYENYNKYENYVEKALREKPVCQLILVELGTVFSLRYDLTHEVFISKKNKVRAIKVKRLIKKLAKENNLFII